MISRIAARRTSLAAVALIILGILLTGWMLVTVVEEFGDNNALRQHGTLVPSRVISIEDTNRGGEALIVSVQLPNGSQAEVDLSDSDHLLSQR